MKPIKITEAWDNKDIIIANCKDTDVGQYEFKRLITASTKEEFEEVLCNNFYWCVENDILTEWLPEILYCKILDCRGCKDLESLPELPNCIELWCGDCIGLISLPELPNCTYLDCSSCTGLESLPELPKCTILYCDERLKKVKIN